MPIKQTLKDKLREESIWIALLIIFGATLLVGITIIAKEVKYYAKGESAVATRIEDGAKLQYEIDGNIYKINARSVFSQSGDTVKVYYFKGEEADAIVMSNLEWWILSIIIPLMVVVLSVLSLYKGLRKRKMVRQKYDYEKKKLTSEELGKILFENHIVHQKNLFEKHLENEEFETIKNNKSFGDIEKEILEEQSKIWKVGSIYLAVIRNYKTDSEYHVKVYFTDSVRYLKDPYLLNDMVNKPDMDGLEDIYECYAIADKNMVGRLLEDNKFFWVVAKPGLVKNCVLLPEWYYMWEELEAM